MTRFGRISVAAILLSLWPSLLAFAQDAPNIPDKLVVATRNVPPFAMQDDEGRWNGISVELLREIKAELEKQSEHGIEIDFRELALQEMLDAVERGEVDLAAAALTVNYEREKVLDFSHPFYNSGLGIAVDARQGRGWRAVLAAVFSPTFIRLLIGLFGVLVAAGIAVYFFERKHNPNDFGGGALRGMGAGLWWAAVTMTTVGYGDKVPRTTAGKAIGLLWMFSGLFIIASFTAAVTSALTVTQLHSNVSGPNDLPRLRVATVRDSTSDRYLRSRHIIAERHDTVNAALAELHRGAVNAVVYDAPILRHEVLQHYSDDLHVLPLTFERQDYAFALPPGSPLRENINRILLRKIESPDWDDILYSYLGEQ